MRTGSEHSPVSTVRGPTFLRSEIARTQFVSAHICTGRAIWWSASSTGSSNAGASLPDMTNSPRTTLPSSSSQPFGFGYALMSPRPRLAASNWAVARRSGRGDGDFPRRSSCLSARLLQRPANFLHAYPVVIHRHYLLRAPIGGYRRRPRCRWIVSVSGPSSLMVDFDLGVVRSEERRVGK